MGTAGNQDFKVEYCHEFKIVHEMALVSNHEDQDGIGRDGKISAVTQSNFGVLVR